MELNYKSFGQGEPIIILHGLFGTLDNWQTIAKQLAETHTVFIVDQRNHGRSPHLSQHNYALMAEDLRIFMENHWIYEATILGHSMGGKTAMQLAFHNPDMVSKLIVVDIAPKAYLGGHEEVLDALTALDLKHITDRKEAELFLQKHIKDLSTRQFVLKNLTRNPDNTYTWKMNLSVLYNSYQQILANVETIDIFDKPTLFIRGSRSDYILDSDISMIHQMFPQAIIKTVENAGHWVHAENPARLLQEVKLFLK